MEPGLEGSEIVLSTGEESYFHYGKVTEDTGVVVLQIESRNERTPNTELCGYIVGLR